MQRCSGWAALLGKQVERTSGSSSACPGACCFPAQQQFRHSYLLPEKHRLMSALVMPETLLTQPACLHDSLFSLGRGRLRKTMCKPEVYKYSSEHGSELFPWMRVDFRGTS